MKKPTAKQAYISSKISKIMHEGLRGKPVRQDQAIAVAIDMQKNKKHGM